MIDEWNLSKEKRRLRREDNPYICDFSRGGLNIRLGACIQTLLRGRKYALFISLSSARWQLQFRKSAGEIWKRGQEM